MWMLLGIANARIGPLFPWTSERWWLARALVGIAGLRCRLRRSGGRWLAWLLFLRLRDLRLFRLQRYFTLGSNLLGAAYLHDLDTNDFVAIEADKLNFLRRRAIYPLFILRVAIFLAMLLRWAPLGVNNHFAIHTDEDTVVLDGFFRLRGNGLEVSFGG